MDGISSAVNIRQQRAFCIFLRILAVTKSQFEVLDLITVDINMG